MVLGWDMGVIHNFFTPCMEIRSSLWTIYPCSQSKIFKEGGSMESQEKYVTRLVYVQAKLNGKSMVVMVDSGTNHHFIREDIMKILRL